MNPMIIDHQGRLALPPPVAEEIGPRGLELVSASAQHLFLAADADSSGVVFAGRLGEIGIPDVLSFLNMFQKTGVLSFSLEGGIKNLYFDGGEIVYATSTFPQEEFGHILLTQGKVDSAILKKARAAAPDPIALGKFLMEKKLLASKDIWLITRQVVEEIVYHLFTFHAGSFYYVHRSFSSEEILRLSLSTQNLIMEGLRRVDERALFMRSIRSLDAIVVPTGKPSEDLGPAEARVMEIVRAERAAVRDLLRRSGLGEFEAMRLLYDLGERKMLEFTQSSSASMEGDLAEILSLYNGILTTLHGKMSMNTRDFNTIRAFLLDLPQPLSYVFRDVALREDGAVDGGRILANLAGLEEGDKKKLLADGLSELVYMECHLARKKLGDAGSAQTLSRVEEVLERISTLVGRNG
jgi:hypothetical protein